MCPWMGDVIFPKSMKLTIVIKSRNVLTEYLVAMVYLNFLVLFMNFLAINGTLGLIT